MEYVGEVLDAKQFRKRAKRYAKDDVQHFYFMALTSEHVIDASNKGNISRFINHSCYPNAETQKVRLNKTISLSCNHLIECSNFLVDRKWRTPRGFLH